MDLFTYLMAKKGHNTHRDLFSYLLGKNAGGSGAYTTFSGTSLNISNTLQAKIKNIALEGNTSQDGTPTPDTPIPIKVVTGNQNVEIKNSDSTLSQNYPLSLGNIELAKIGDYKDYIFKNVVGSPYYNADLDLNGWYVCENIEKLLLDGTENNWVNYSLTFYLNGNSPKTLNALCSHFIKQPDVNWASSNPIYRGKFSMYNIANQIKFMPTDENITTLELWKEWLSNNNVKLIYGKETPTYTKITNTTLIQQLENINNNARSYKDTTIIECSSVSADNETIVFSGDIKVTSVNLGNSLNTSLLSSNIQEEPNLDDVNEIEEIEEPIENEEVS